MNVSSFLNSASIPRSFEGPALQTRNELELELRNSIEFANTSHFPFFIPKPQIQQPSSKPLAGLERNAVKAHSAESSRLPSQSLFPEASQSLE